MSKENIVLELNTESDWDGTSLTALHRDAAAVTGQRYYAFNITGPHGYLESDFGGLFSPTTVKIVGVEGGERQRPRLPAGVLHPGLDGCPLAQVDRMGQHVRARPQGEFGGVVATSVIHADHVGERRPQGRDDLADDPRLVESWNDDPDAGLFDDHNLQAAAALLIGPSQRRQVHANTDQRSAHKGDHGPGLQG